MRTLAVEKCCGCASLKTGVLALSALHCLSSSLFVAFLVHAAENWLSLIVYFMIIIFVLSFISGLTYAGGVLTDNEDIIHTYDDKNSIADSVVGFVMLVMFALFLFLDKDEFNLFKPKFLEGVVIWLFLHFFLEIYYEIIIHSYAVKCALPQ